MKRKMRVSVEIVIEVDPSLDNYQARKKAMEDVEERLAHDEPDLYELDVDVVDAEPENV